MTTASPPYVVYPATRPASPQVADLERKMWNFATALPPLHPEPLLEAAVQLTGHADFGDPWFREPLDALCTSLRSDANLNSFGLVSHVQLLLRLLTVRLTITQLLNRVPEITRLPIEAPVVVTGLPYSGAASLHAWLSADPRLRYARDDEWVDPLGNVDSVGDGDGSHDRDRLEAVLDLVLPELQQFQETGGDTRNDTVLLAYSFGSTLFEHLASVPGYRDWYLATDQAPAYAYLRTLLQVLQWRGGGGRWLLTAPQHMEQVPALRSAFPDGRIVFAHRDPAAVLPRLATLAAYFARLNARHVDPAAIGRYWAGRVADMVERCTADRALLRDDQSLDVHHDSDPTAVLEGVYRLAGLPARPAPAGEDRWWHAGAFGRDLGEVGLHPRVLRTVGAGYLDRFGIATERV